MLDRIPHDSKAPGIVVLMFYFNAFHSRLGLPLREKDPKDLEDAMEKVVTLEGYMMGFSEDALNRGATKPPPKRGTCPH